MIETAMKGLPRITMAGKAFLVWILLFPALVQGQTQSPLTLEQVQSLLRIGAPDTTVAHEIRTRGVAFALNRDLLAQLETEHAGTMTLGALREFLPILDEAKRAIPGLLRAIYSALDQGNPSAVRLSVSNELINNSIKLDTICRPFTYRAHYVESIIERPQRRFEVRARVLFKPLDEHAYVLLFRVAQDNFVLEDVTEPSAEWFGPEFSAASELTRRFVYAVKAGRQDVLAQSVSAGVDTSRFIKDACWQLLLQDVNQVQVGQVRLNSYKGLKTYVSTNLPGNFLVDQFDGEYRIVSAFNGIESSMYFFNDREGKCRDSRQHFKSAEDPNLESYTLKRFGINAPLPTEQTPLTTAGPTQASVPGTSQIVRVTVRHKHKALSFGPGAASNYFCEGELIVGPNAVEYDCNQRDAATQRCERTSLSPVRDVQYKDGGLRIVGRGGNWDFFGNDTDLKTIFDLLSASLAHDKK